MISALASGQLVRAPKHGTSASGTRWANALLRCSTGTDREGAALTSFVTVCCFGEQADHLARLGQGDAISVQGAMKQTEYIKDGQTRHGLEITAQSLLSAYQVRKKRGEAAQEKNGKAGDREQNRAYANFARGVKASATATADFDDPIGF